MSAPPVWSISIPIPDGTRGLDMDTKAVRECLDGAGQVSDKELLIKECKALSNEKLVTLFLSMLILDNQHIQAHMGQWMRTPVVANNSKVQDFRSFLRALWVEPLAFWAETGHLYPLHYRSLNIPIKLISHPLMSAALHEITERNMFVSTTKDPNTKALVLRHFKYDDIYRRVIDRVKITGFYAYCVLKDQYQQREALAAAMTDICSDLEGDKELLEKLSKIRSVLTKKTFQLPDLAAFYLPVPGKLKT